MKFLLFLLFFTAVACTEQPHGQLVIDETLLEHDTMNNDLVLTTTNASVKDSLFKYFPDDTEQHFYYYGAAEEFKEAVLRLPVNDSTQLEQFIKQMNGTNWEHDASR